MNKIVITSFFLLLTFSQCDSSVMDKITDAARSVKNFFSKSFGLSVSKPRQTKMAYQRTIRTKPPKTLGKTTAAAITITMMWDVYHIDASKLQDDLSVEELSKEADVVVNHGNGEDDNNPHADSMELEKSVDDIDHTSEKGYNESHEDSDSEDGEDCEDCEYETVKEEGEESI